MSKTTKTISKASTGARVRKQASASERVWVRKPRKATFTVKVVKGERVFTAVNARAHKLARLLGKRTRLTLADMRQAKELNRYKLYINDNGNVDKAIKV